jgi:hypothetical protein
MEDDRALANIRERLNTEIEEFKEVMLALLNQAYFNGSQDRFVEMSTKRSPSDEHRTNQ